MSQKKETTVLVLALLLTLLLGGVGAWVVKKFMLDRATETPISSENTTIKPIPNAAQISFGEKTLIPGQVTPAKQAGLDAIATGKWNVAVTNLQQARKENRNDPETLIFLNNAEIAAGKSYTIAASAPLGTDPKGGLEILRGVAQAQNEINHSGGINNVRLKVAIANDNNQEDQAKQIANTLVNNTEILGVIGHWASQVTLATAPIYNSGKLVAISPISTSVKLSGLSPYIFRTVPSDYVSARALANYMITTLKLKNAAVFFNSQSAYSQSLKSEFVTAVLLAGGRVIGEFDLSDPSFSAASSINQALQKQAQVLMLAANTSTLDKALQVVQVNRKRLKLLGGDDVYASTTLEVGGDAAQGMVVAVPWDIDTAPETEFVRESKQLWGAEVNWRTALSYDATRTFIAAIQSSPTRSGIQQVLSSPNFSITGAAGAVQFLPSGDRNAPVQLVKIVPNVNTITGYDFVPVRQ
ncbi:MAG TPA: receptor ligand binding family protein [Cyanobacteria bacterium UBA11049]|nr:receptor ligand binding family protein [Cyanobacteria bacterium UBA11049]